jgi:hypothetical protein
MLARELQQFVIGGAEWVENGVGAFALFHTHPGFNHGGDDVFRYRQGYKEGVAHNVADVRLGVAQHRQVAPGV